MDSNLSEQDDDLLDDLMNIVQNEKQDSNDNKHQTTTKNQLLINTDNTNVCFIIKFKNFKFPKI
jgi:hypothetical protein